MKELKLIYYENQEKKIIKDYLAGAWDSHYALGRLSRLFEDLIKELKES